MKKPADLRVFLRTENGALGSEYFHVMAELSCPYSSLDGLVVQCQADHRPEHKEAFGTSYGWEVGYASVWVDEEFCRRKVKVLRRVNRQMQRWNEKFGPPQDFGRYLQRIMEYIGAKTAMCQVKGDNLEGCNVAVSEVPFVVERALRGFHERSLAGKGAGI